MKEQKESSRHHFVPITYLKKFSFISNKSNRTVAVDKLDNDRVFTPILNKICVRQNLYQLNSDDRDERQLIEKFYNEEVERNYDTVYALLTDPEKIKITTKERELIILTIISLYFRNILWLKRFSDVFDSVIGEAYRVMIESGSEKIGSSFGDVDCKGKTLEQVKKAFQDLNREKFVIDHIKHMLDLAKLRFKDDITVIKLKGDSEFITSDNPVKILSQDYQNIVPFNLENIIALPIDNRHQVMIMPKSWSSGNDEISRWTDNMSNFHEMMNNGMQYENAHQFVIGSQFGINNFLSRKDHYFQSVDPEETERSEQSLERIFSLMRKAGISTQWFEKIVR